MRVALGKFAREAIESHLGSRPATAVEAALVHYARSVNAMRSPPRIPQLARDGSTPEAVLALEIEVHPTVQSIVEEEARRSEVSVDQVVAHAVFVFLADLDSASDETPDTDQVPNGKGHLPTTPHR